MAQARQVQLPRMLRNPIVALEFAGEVEEWAEEVEKRAAESGRTVREKGRVTKLKAIAKQLRTEAEARIGDQAD